MLGTITFMGIGLFGWYVCTVIMSFCTTMAGNSYLKISGAVPEDYKPVPAAVITSLMPIFNILSAIRMFRMGLKCWKDPKASENYRKSYEKLAKSVNKVAEDLMEMGRKNKEDNE